MFKTGDMAYLLQTKAGHAENHANDIIRGVTELRRRLYAKINSK